MSESVPKAIRPTIACLPALATGFENVGQARIVRSGHHESVDLGSLEHPLLRHCTELFADREARRQQKPIAAARPMTIYKAKTTNWRGAVFLDANDQPWLIDAGLRRNGDTDDFYDQFARKQHDSLLPTDQDHHLLAVQLAELMFDAWQRSVRSTTVTAVAAAAKTPGQHVRWRSRAVCPPRVREGTRRGLSVGQLGSVAYVSGTEP